MPPGFEQRASKVSSDNRPTALARRDGVLFYCNNEAVYNDQLDHDCPRAYVPLPERTQMEELQFGHALARCQPALGHGDERLVNNLNAKPSSRREFIRLSGLAVGASALALSGTVSAAGLPAEARDPDSVLARLLEGNKRFASGQLVHPGRQPADFAALAAGQSPVAIIVGCADSRVAPSWSSTKASATCSWCAWRGILSAARAPPLREASSSRSPSWAPG